MSEWLQGQGSSPTPEGGHSGGGPTLLRGLGNLMEEKEGCYLTFCERGAPPHLGPRGTAVGTGQPLTPGFAHWGSHTAVFRVSSIIVCVSFPGWP